MPRPHQCDKRCAPHTCTPSSVSSVRQWHAVLSSALGAAFVPAVDERLDGAEEFAD